MELKEFVKRSLVEVMQGVSEANAELGASMDLNDQILLFYRHESLSDNPQIDFDIAVTAEDTSKVSGNIKGSVGIKVAELVNLAGIDGSSEGYSTSVNSSISRIKFSIYINKSITLAKIKQKYATSKK